MDLIFYIAAAILVGFAAVAVVSAIIGQRKEKKAAEAEAAANSKEAL